MSRGPRRRHRVDLSRRRLEWTAATGAGVQEGGYDMTGVRNTRPIRFGQAPMARDPSTAAHVGSWGAAVWRSATLAGGSQTGTATGPRPRSATSSSARRHDQAAPLSKNRLWTPRRRKRLVEWLGTWWSGAFVYFCLSVRHIGPFGLDPFGHGDSEAGYHGDDRRARTGRRCRSDRLTRPVTRSPETRNPVGRSVAVIAESMLRPLADRRHGRPSLSQPWFPIARRFPAIVGRFVHGSPLAPIVRKGSYS